MVPQGPFGAEAGEPRLDAYLTFSTAAHGPDDEK